MPFWQYSWNIAKMGFKSAPMFKWDLENAKQKQKKCDLEKIIIIIKEINSKRKMRFRIILFLHNKKNKIIKKIKDKIYKQILKKEKLN